VASAAKPVNGMLLAKELVGKAVDEATKILIPRTVEVFQREAKFKMDQFLRDLDKGVRDAEKRIDDRCEEAEARFAEVVEACKQTDALTKSLLTQVAEKSKLLTKADAAIKEKNEAIEALDQQIADLTSKRDEEQKALEKLQIKQAASRRSSLGSWVSVIGFLVFLATIVCGFSYFRNGDPSPLSLLNGSGSKSIAVAGSEPREQQSTSPATAPTAVPVTAPVPTVAKTVTPATTAPAIDWKSRPGCYPAKSSGIKKEGDTFVREVNGKKYSCTDRTNEQLPNGKEVLCGCMVTPLAENT
jgi:hypothetical protein